MSAVAQQPAPAAVAPGAGLVKLAKDVFAGTCGGIAVTFVGHPFDTLKVRLQTQPVDKPVYSGVVDCARKTVQWEGLGGLYKGVASPLMGQMFFRASLFGAFGSSKRWLATNTDGSTRPLQRPDYYTAGAMTGFVAAFTEGPIDLYKSQLQVQIIRSKQDPNYKAPFTSVFECVRQTIRTNGIRGPFQGLSATLLRNVPANAVYLGNFDVFKNAVAEHYGVRPAELSAAAVAACAGVTGISYWLVIFPVDCVKSAMQTDAINPAQRRYPNVAATVSALWAEGGLRRFFKGFSPCLMRAVPANGVMLLTVDKITHFLNRE
ncbi:hypothetical protein Agub_g14609 [Astrephomene gubernaculifera]|uniref:Uncharacterized protein n=1 Tax=Astrephomene gubernaculifera TaxID=47775 RepID=A0AAD3E5U7_9CHLO|nr:hypothetical protein Agub_g14609 [Astrephomene gubernaculifera]